MKLLYCPSCHDVFKLTYTPRSCECGKVAGRYVNNVEAVTNGKGVSLAIGNGSLLMAAGRVAAIPPGADRKVYQEEGKVLCWVQPNEGPGNPHTAVDEEEEAL